MALNELNAQEELKPGGETGARSGPPPEPPRAAKASALYYNAQLAHARNAKTQTPLTH